MDLPDEVIEGRFVPHPDADYPPWGAVIVISDSEDEAPPPPVVAAPRLGPAYPAPPPPPPQLGLGDFLVALDRPVPPQVGLNLWIRVCYLKT